MMRVLHATTELFPWVKTGGLADVAAALPEALGEIGVDTRTVVPGFPAIMAALENPAAVYDVRGLFATATMRVLYGRLPGRKTAVYVVDSPALFQRPGNPYSHPQGGDWNDNLLRFAMLGWAAAKLASGELDRQWRPDVLHVHDWHPALAHAYLSETWPPTKTVFTIHNIDYSGRFPPHDYGRLGLPHWLAAPYGPLEFFGDLCFLKAGMLLAHRVTTVSPTYAEEITHGRFGGGLDGVVRSRSDRLLGILNGVDYRTWDPRHDPHLPGAYDSQSLAGKTACQARLRQHFSLAENAGSPIFTVISRLNWQKGLDLVVDAAETIVSSGAQLVVIGSGDAHLEWQFRQLQQRFPRQIGVHVGYSEPLAHLSLAGGDTLLMPSRHEPCGLTQLYAKRYGTLPVVQSVGGLADTVDPQTGFIFDEHFTSLSDVVQHVAYVYRDQARWQHMMRTAMGQDFGWENSAREYLRVYRELQG
jgi:starch synthase